MTSISSGIPINQANVKPLEASGLKKMHVSELPEETYQRFVEGQQKSLEMKYMQFPDTANNPTYKEYATVTVNGKVVAEIDNHGWTKTSNGIGGKIQNGLPMSVGSVISGPELAQARAEYIAEQLGGKVEISSTALTQSQFNKIPQPKPTVDYEAMMKDPAFEQLQKTQEARTLFLAQQLAQEQEETQETTTFTETSELSTSKQTAEDEFREFMEKTPEEIIYEAILKELGLTEEQFEALPPEEQEKITEQIEQKIKDRVAAAIDEQVSGETGTYKSADSTAPLEKFEALIGNTAEELYYEEMLQSKALTKEEFQALPADAKDVIASDVKASFEKNIVISVSRSQASVSFSLA